MEEYAAYLMEEELAEGTIELYVREARHLIKYLSGSEITGRHMVEYKRYLSNCGYSPVTQNLYITAANRYLKYLGKESLTVKTNRLQGHRSLTRVISREEYEKMTQYAKRSGRDKYYAILKTLAMTGIRVSELRYFTVDALDKESIYITNKKKTREICLPENLTMLLRSYCQKAGIEHGVIFRGSSDAPISRVAVYKMLQKLADMTGVPAEKAHPHNLRHLFAITYMTYYSDLFELADLLGHSSLETTRIYTKCSMEEKGRRINALGL